MKKIISRFMIFVMLITIALGINTPSMANEVTYYEGTFTWSYFPDNILLSEEVQVHAVYSNYELNFQFIDSKGCQVKGYVTKPTHRETFVKLKSGFLTIDDYKVEINGGADVYPDNNIEFAGKTALESDVGWYLYGTLFPVESPVFHQFSSPFVGFAVSDQGSYALSLAGYFEMELQDGISKLSPAQIAEQTIAIVARNHATGETSVIREDTIETITVTVSGGNVTNCVIRGKVQTDNGQLDYYTCTITP